MTAKLLRFPLALLCVAGSARPALGQAAATPDNRVLIDASVLWVVPPTTNQAYSGTFVAFVGAPTSTTTNTTYATWDSAIGYRVKGTYLFSKFVGAAVGVQSSTHDTTANLEATVPHPFLGVPSATDTSSIGSLKARQTAVDIAGVLYLPVALKVRVAFEGGPSFFRVTQDLINHISYSQTFDPTGPSNSINLSENAFATAEATSTGWGGHVGGEVDVILHRHASVIGSARYHFGQVSITDPLTGSTSEVKVGGFSLGGGFRLRF